MVSYALLLRCWIVTVFADLSAHPDILSRFEQLAPTSPTLRALLQLAAFGAHSGAVNVAAVTVSAVVVAAGVAAVTVSAGVVTVSAVVVAAGVGVVTVRLL